MNQFGMLVNGKSLGFTIKMNDKINQYPEVKRRTKTFAADHWRDAIQQQQMS